ncbi:hypothetical protein K466DRAFT_601973 [Polyporus arcularius HHB13444]|uniref:Uncharacterized protein n=1 Tax=Polyporus arcularius HHB13444 TaxID=1314778 RepID=A0A5C3P665_9APHY|nr:hypothetical protein K466DRAFT_601973 [Polyporus arcularius HHB13444]
MTTGYYGQNQDTITGNLAAMRTCGSAAGVTPSYNLFASGDGDLAGAQSARLAACTCAHERVLD